MVLFNVSFLCFPGHTYPTSVFIKCIDNFIYQSFTESFASSPFLRLPQRAGGQRGTLPLTPDWGLVAEEVMKGSMESGGWVISLSSRQMLMLLGDKTRTPHITFFRFGEIAQEKAKIAK